MKQNKWYIEKIEDKIKRHIEGRLKLVGEFLSGIARALAPVLTGNLRGSIYYKIYGYDTLRVGDNAFYAVYVEFGTGEYAENGLGRKGGWFYVDEKGQGHFTKGRKPKHFILPLIQGYESEVKQILTAGSF